MTKQRSQTTSYLGLILIMTGLAIVTATIVVWIVIRGPDQIAISSLPTTTPLPTLAPTAEPQTELTLSETAIPPTPLATAPFIPTPELETLPSEARLSDAPTSMRQTIAGQPQRIVIPSIGVDAPVRDVGISAVYDQGQGTDIFYQWQVPQYYAAGWHHDSAPIRATGNTVLNGHQNVFGEVFRDLEQLAVGDGIIMYDEQGSRLYEIVNKEILLERGQPEEIRSANAQWIQPTADERLTLVTCWPYTDNSHRLVIVAKPADIANP